MRYRMSVIYGHPVIAATRAFHFADHVTKRNRGSGDENVFELKDDFKSILRSLRTLMFINIINSSLDGMGMDVIH